MSVQKNVVFSHSSLALQCLLLLCEEDVISEIMIDILIYPFRLTVNTNSICQLLKPHRLDVSVHCVPMIFVIGSDNGCTLKSCTVTCVKINWIFYMYTCVVYTDM